MALVMHGNAVSFTISQLQEPAMLRKSHGRSRCMDHQADNLRPIADMRRPVQAHALNVNVRGFGKGIQRNTCCTWLGEHFRLTWRQHMSGVCESCEAEINLYGKRAVSTVARISQTNTGTVQFCADWAHKAIRLSRHTW